MEDCGRARCQTGPLLLSPHTLTLCRHFALRRSSWELWRKVESDEEEATLEWCPGWALDPSLHRQDICLVDFDAYTVWRRRLYAANLLDEASSDLRRERHGCYEGGFISFAAGLSSK